MNAVEFNTQAVCVEDAGSMASLLERTALLGRSCRRCLHRSHADGVQEMVIAHASGTYVRPHRHRGRSVSYHMVQGSLLFALFEVDGNLARTIELSAFPSPAPYLLRLGDDSWYMPIPISPMAVFHETIEGPFTGSDFTEWAPWAPSLQDEPAIAGFVESILRTRTTQGENHG